MHSNYYSNLSGSYYTRAPLMVVLSPDGVEVSPGMTCPLRVFNDNHSTHAQLCPQWVQAHTCTSVSSAQNGVSSSAV